MANPAETDHIDPESDLREILQLARSGRCHEVDHLLTKEKVAALFRFFKGMKAVPAVALMVGQCFCVDTKILQTDETFGFALLTQPGSDEMSDADEIVGVVYMEDIGRMSENDGVWYNLETGDGTFKLGPITFDEEGVNDRFGYNILFSATEYLE